MAAAQARLAETLQKFYTVHHETEGAMAGHAYKQSADDLDSGLQKELVCIDDSFALFLTISNKILLGNSIPHYCFGAAGKDGCDFTHHQRTHNQKEQEGTL